MVKAYYVRVVQSIYGESRLEKMASNISGVTEIGGNFSSIGHFHPYIPMIYMAMIIMCMTYIPKLFNVYGTISVNQSINNNY